MDKAEWGQRLDSRKIIIYMLYGAVFFLPLSQVLVDIILASALVMALRRCAVKKIWELRGGPFWIPAAGFMACSFISIFVSRAPWFSFYNWVLLPGAYMVLYVLIMSYLDTDKERETALYVFLAGALCVVAYGFFQFVDMKHIAASTAAMDWVDPERFPLLYRRMYSTLGNPNLLSAYLLMIMALLGSFMLMEKQKSRKWVFLLCLAAFFVCLILTYSRSAWVSFACMTALAAVIYDRRIGAVFLLVPVILLVYHGQVTERFLSLFSGQDTSTALRFALWESTEAMISDYPLSGVGWGTYFLAYPDYNFFIQDPHILIYHAHNMYLSIPAEIGIPGAICFFWFFLCHGWQAWRMYRQGEVPFTRALGLGTVIMLAGMAVNGAGDYALFSRAVSLCFWCICALSASAGKDMIIR